MHNVMTYDISTYCINKIGTTTLRPKFSRGQQHQYTTSVGMYYSMSVGMYQNQYHQHGY